MLFGRQPNQTSTAFLSSTRSAYEIRNMAIADRLDIADMDLLDGQCCSVVTKARVNAFTFVASFVSRFGRIDRLAIATYRIGKETAQELERMVLSNRVAECDLLVNDNMAAMKPEVCELLRQINQRGTVRLWWQNNHAKVFAIHAGGGHYTIVGSGNLTENGKTEAYMIIRDKALYEFHLGWICRNDLGARRRMKL